VGFRERRDHQAVVRGDDFVIKMWSRPSRTHLPQPLQNRKQLVVRLFRTQGKLLRGLGERTPLGEDVLSSEFALGIQLRRDIAMLLHAEMSREKREVVP
jgi:hypothetical protein